MRLARFARLLFHGRPRPTLPERPQSIAALQPWHLLFAISVSLCPTTRAAPPPPQSSNPAPVVTQYALTSANDFPQRDPQDWRLLGSNDGGRTWTTIDVRKKELFNERHERRVFKTANKAPFRLYRLQIDRVREPGPADCVQLAEVEPMSETGDDVGPLPGDIISAQGENPPLETARHAFDGEPETKWLDHATQDPGSRSSWIQWEYSSTAGFVVTSVKQLLSLGSRAESRFPVRLEGVVVPRGAGASGMVFLDRSGCYDLDDSITLPPGQPAKLSGKTAWLNRRVRVEDCSLEPYGPRVSGIPQRIGLDQVVEPSHYLRWSEIEGVAQFFTRSKDQVIFELVEDQRNVAVRVAGADALASLPPISGKRVRIRGTCELALNSLGHLVPATIWIPDFASIQPADSQSLHVSSGGATVLPVLPQGSVTLTNVDQIRRVSPEQLVRWPKVKVRGIVTELFGGYMQEERAGVEIWLGTNAPAQLPPFSSCIEVEGRGDWAIGHGPIIRVDAIRVLGPGKLPVAERCTWSHLASGRMVDQWVEIEGVVRATDGSHVLLNCEGGQMMATIRSGAASAVRNLVDATVRIRGVSVPASDSHGRMQGVQLLVPSLAFVEVEHAPSDPFSLSPRQIGSLLQVRAPNEFVHRVKVEGIVTFHEGGTYFVQDATGGAMAVAQQDVVLGTPGTGWSWMFSRIPDTNGTLPNFPAVSIGDRLQVVGFPEMRGYSPVLTEVQVRNLGKTNAVMPVAATVQEIAKGSLDCTLVSLQALVLRQQILGPNHVIELESGGSVFQAFLPARYHTRPALAPGCRVQAIGVCQLEPLPYPEFGRSFGSFKLWLSSPRDLLVLERPSSWTLKRALVAVGVLAVVLALASAWIWVLRRQVEERTRELQEEIAEHETTEAQLAQETRRVQAEIEERKRMESEVEKGHRQLLRTSRLAGMAEVASSVLHNVGNVLNSANVLASLALEQIQTSKISSVSRLALLLKEYQDGVAKFLTEDERGRLLPGYVKRLGQHLTQEQTRLLGNVKSLTESIQHIKEIVATQQNYAKISGVLETVSVEEIVEDGLRMHSSALARHQVKLIREFMPMPLVTTDRHKILQILFNLLENAKYACDSSLEPERQITVRIFPGPAQTVQVQVADNGVGIAPDDLARIFAQDFSRRKGGHGLGLHSSLLAAQDIGGSLRAESDGPGKGARFTLTIPAVIPFARESARAPASVDSRIKA